MPQAQPPGSIKSSRRSWALIATVFLLGSSCIHPGTSMHPTCKELPTVEECQAAAQVITHDCLRKCIEQQCAGVQINCNSEEIRKNCKDKSGEGIVALGYVVRFSDRPTSCDHPSREVNWCEHPSSRDCRAKAMVHELAHSCGWQHNQGLGVPGNDAAGNVPTINGDFRQARLELQNVSFDGETLSGRLLISPVSANLRIDKRLIESIALSVDSLVECGTGTGLAYVIMDVLAPPPQETDILTLAPGFWYGKEVRLLLFASEATRQPLSQCIEAEIVYHALDVKNAARIHVRAERNLPAAPTPDAEKLSPDKAEGAMETK